MMEEQNPEETQESNEVYVPTHRYREASQERINASSPLRMLVLGFTIFMVLIFLGIGVLCIVDRKTLIFLDPRENVLIGIVLIMYGCFRGYRAYISYKQ